MKKETFKKIVILQLVLLPIYAIKGIMYPYHFVPEELKKAMLMFDELQPLPDTFILFLLIIFLLAYIISLFLLYRLNYYGRLIFLWTTIFSFIFVFSSSYYVFDSVDYLLEMFGSLITGFTIAVSYFSPISKQFKK